MGTNSNQRKAETLGMPGGTANSRLRKILIYALLHTVAAYRERFGPLNYPGSDGSYPIRAWGLHCHVCKQEIKSPEDMTIEHIKPWEGRENGSDLFWDLENIAFSHKWCNRPHIAVFNPKPLVHGSHNTYDRKGCRCIECTQAKREHNLERYTEGNCRA